MLEYTGSCLCGETTYTANSEPINPHLCSCTMCQKSSGAPTVAWVSFALKDFKWNKDSSLEYFQSSEKVRRCFCKACGCLFGAVSEGCDSICMTIASLDKPNLIIPGKQHSFHDSAPSWWKVDINNQ